MAVEEREYKRLKEQAEKAKSDHDRAAGQLEAAMVRLKDEFGCATVEDAGKLLKKLEREADKAEATYEEAKATFEEEWAARLEGEDE